MKKLINRRALVSVMLCTFLMLFLSGNAQAASKTSGDYKYTIKGNTVTIVKYIGSKKSVTVPSKIKGKKVTKIGNNAFASCKKVESITLPNSITKIEYLAFRECEKLKTITLPKGLTILESQVFEGCIKLQKIKIPDQVKEIESFTFENCKNLKQVTLPDGLIQLGENSFSNCKSLKKITIPSKVKIIYMNTFTGCKNLQQVILPTGLKEIKGFAFSNCESLNGITLPDAVEKIGTGAFQNCKNLKAITIPQNVKKLGERFYEYSVEIIQSNVFKGCLSLSAINVNQNNTVYSSIDGILYNKKQDVLYYCPQGYTQTIVIPDSVVRLSNGAFMFNRLKEVNMPTKLEEIGGNTFYGCKELEGILFPNSLKKIGNGAFYDCTSIKNIEVPKGIDMISSLTFYNCSGLETIILQDGLQTIGDSAFYNCKALKEFLLPAGLQTIASDAFINCETIQSITIPKSVTVLERNFIGCSSLKKITVEIENPAYSSVNGVLYNKKKDKLIKCPEGYEENLTISIGVKKIGSYAFYGTKMNQIVLPEGIEEIEEAAFRDCKKLTKILLPKSLRLFGHDAEFQSPFRNCTSLKRIEVNSGNKYFYSKDGILFRKNTESHSTRIMCYPAAREGKTYSVPKGIGVSDYCFDSCVNLKKIVIPEGIDTLYNICVNCKNITVEIPKSVKHFPTSEHTGDFAWFKNSKNCVGSVYKNSAAMKYAKTYKMPYKIRKA